MRCSPSNQRSPGFVTGVEVSFSAGRSFSSSLPEPSNATSISPISKPLMRRSISPLISIMSENSSLRASRSQRESSLSRLSASRSTRSLVSSRSVMVTAGTSGKPCKRQSPTGDHAAGRIDDDRKDEAELFDARLQLADLRGRVFARLPAERLERFNADKIWIEIAGNGKATPAQHGLCFHHRSPSNGPGANHLVTSYQQTGPAEFTKLHRGRPRRRTDGSTRSAA